ncbi:MAG: hypothetical protein L0332_20525 [Chloroflexi bacterium]|nr:hypothetical protein [Chloroflexota bacterium]MCI0580289.1 hypothetical protein [Chloroflexota bacterium]MCI0643700.1 hypothetical protein [Chloroflexota bacterium]MCI0729084.1 hypothetical protein [Chloroflexota bacterium]
MSQETDRALLRRFEPVIRFTRGEQFFPVNIERYVWASSLWVHRPQQFPLRLVPESQLTLERLAEPRAHGSDAVYYLKFIEPLNITEMARIRLQESLGLKESHDVFRAGPGRLARVGYGSRFVDALFSLSLLARGRVPGDTAVAAALAYRRLLAEQEQYCYYGRVVRRNGWLTLQYWFFYPYNNWRSGYAGANDHEGDWEMVCVYVYEDEPGQLRPDWIAYASHDFSGDDLRRRWDDPELEKVGEHPVIYAGAGSHASYFQRGEYLAELELPFLRPVVQFVDRLQLIWERIILTYDSKPEDRQKWSEYSIFRVPFVDYARGDGLAIGPGQEREWDEPQLLDPPPGWVSQYRGLWGLFARDPFSGENAPAGPMYNRDGTVRHAWYDPLGWAGLDKVPPPNQRAIFIQRQREEIESRRADLAGKIEVLSQELRGLGVELAGMQGLPHLRQAQERQQKQIAAVSTSLNGLQAQLAADEALLEAINLYAARVQAGERTPLRAHIRRAHHPTSAESLRLNRFAEFWAAVSVGVMMVSFILLVLFARGYLLFGLAAAISLMVFIEASFRRRVTRFITSVTIGLAVVSAFVLLFEFFWTVVVVAVLAAGSYTMWENIRELRR